MYEIKSGYQENEEPAYFVDENGAVWQPDVYTFAEWVAEMTGANTIIDIGCGHADKLGFIHENHPDWNLIGYDFGDNIEFCGETYEWGTWVERDFEQPFSINGEDAVVVCSDVIEHLVNPLPLVHALRDSGFGTLLISTPERNVTYGKDHMGPPPNPAHVREWGSAELKRFLEREGLKVRHLGLTRSHVDGAFATQLVVITRV